MIPYSAPGRMGGMVGYEPPDDVSYGAVLYDAGEGREPMRLEAVPGTPVEQDLKTVLAQLMVPGGAAEPSVTGLPMPRAGAGAPDMVFTPEEAGAPDMVFTEEEAAPLVSVPPVPPGLPTERPTVEPPAGQLADARVALAMANLEAAGRPLTSENVQAEVTRLAAEESAAHAAGARLPPEPQEGEPPVPTAPAIVPPAALPVAQGPIGQTPRTLAGAEPPRVTSRERPMTAAELVAAGAAPEEAAREAAGEAAAVTAEREEAAFEREAAATEYTPVQQRRRQVYDQAQANLEAAGQPTTPEAVQAEAVAVSQRRREGSPPTADEAEAARADLRDAGIPSSPNALLDRIYERREDARRTASTEAASRAIAGEPAEPGTAEESAADDAMRDRVEQDRQAGRIPTELGGLTQYLYQLGEEHAGQIISAGRVARQIAARTAEQTARGRARIDREFEALAGLREQLQSARTDPNLFTGRPWASVGAAIGVGLGAFGAALTGTRNFALDIIQQATDNWIESQKAGIEATGRAADIQQNVLARAIQYYGDPARAELAARAMLWESAAGEANRLGITLGTAEASAKAEELAGAARLEAAKLMIQMARTQRGAAGMTPYQQAMVTGWYTDPETGERRPIWAREREAGLSADRAARLAQAQRRLEQAQTREERLAAKQDISEIEREVKEAEREQKRRIELQERSVPGLGGLAPTKQEATNVREGAEAMMDVADTLDALQIIRDRITSSGADYTTFLTGRTEDAVEANRLRQLLAVAMRSAKEKGIMTEPDFQRYLGIINDPSRIGATGYSRMLVEVYSRFRTRARVRGIRTPADVNDFVDAIRTAPPIEAPAPIPSTRARQRARTPAAAQGPATGLE